MAENGARKSFWDFSVRTYSKHGVAEACLALQNEYGADVNMLLYCCWVGGRFGKFGDELFGKACDFSTAWAEKVVRPLRSARTWMKNTGCATEPVPVASCMQLRERIKSVELSCEKMQQEALEALLSTESSRQGSADQTLHDVVANLMRYSKHTGVTVTEDVRYRYGVIIHAAFPELNKQRIDQALA